MNAQELLIDDLVWAIDHLADPRWHQLAYDIIQGAREEVQRIHKRRQGVHVLDLTEAARHIPHRPVV